MDFQILDYAGNMIDLTGNYVDINGCRIYVLKGIAGFRSPTVTFVSDPMPNIPGEELLFVHIPPREITLPILIEGPSRAAVESSTASLMSSCNPHEQVQLICTNDNGNERVLYCRYASGMEVAETVDTMGLYHNTWIPHFMAHDPYWYDETPATKLMTMDVPTTTFGSPMTYTPYEVGCAIKYSNWVLPGPSVNEAINDGSYPLAYSAPNEYPNYITNQIKLSSITAANATLATIKPGFWGTITGFYITPFTPTHTASKTATLNLVNQSGATVWSIAATSALLARSGAPLQGTQSVASTFNSSNTYTIKTGSISGTWAPDVGVANITTVTQPSSQVIQWYYNSYALDFDGRTGWAETANVTHGSSFSMEFIFYPDPQFQAASQAKVISDWSTGNTYGTGWYVGYDTTGSNHLHLVSANGATKPLDLATATSITAGQVWHVVYTWDGATVNVYVWNGTGTAPNTPDASTSFSAGFQYATQMLFGSENTSGSPTFPFNGKLVLFRYYPGKVLTGAQVQNNMNAELWRTVQTPLFTGSTTQVHNYKYPTNPTQLTNVGYNFLNSNPSAISQTLVITNDGDEDAYPFWTITGPGNGIWLSNTYTTLDGNTTTEQLVVNKILATGEPVTIDSRPTYREIIDINGDDIRNLDDPEYDNLFSILPTNRLLNKAGMPGGANIVTIYYPSCYYMTDAVGNYIGSSISLTYQQRYNGV